MKFIVSSSALLKNLQAISGVLNSSNTLPILDNFLFELKDSTLYISASDLETTMTVGVALTNTDEEGSIAIPAKFLLDIMKTFPELPVNFNIDPDSFHIEISAGEGKYKLSGYNADEFPRIPVIENASSFEMNSVSLANAITKTIFATGNDELRPVMAGVYCQLAESDITFVATDAHKLVRYRRNDIAPGEVASFILPKKPLNQLKNILGTIDASVKIEYNEVNAFFSFENVNLICRLIDGKYPNYEAVIPSNNSKKLSISRSQLLNALKRISIFANQSTRQIRFSVAGQELNLSAEDADLANEGKERMSCTFEGEDIEIGFNSKFLIEMLVNMECDEVILEMSAPNRAALILPAEGSELEEDILMLVMPVMLNQ
jgi:DNA polymerase-3 subunit beta